MRSHTRNSSSQRPGLQQQPALWLYCTEIAFKLNVDKVPHRSLMVLLMGALMVLLMVALTTTLTETARNMITMPHALSQGSACLIW